MMRAAMSGGLRPARRATNPILTLHYRGMKLSPRELEKLVRAPHHRKAPTRSQCARAPAAPAAGGPPFPLYKETPSSPKANCAD